MGGLPQGVGAAAERELPQFPLHVKLMLDQPGQSYLISGVGFQCGEGNGPMQARGRVDP